MSYNWTAEEDRAFRRAAGEKVDDDAPGQTPRESGQPPNGRRALLTPISEIRSERVRWLWTGRVPLRGQVILAGEKGLGKSILTNACLPAKLTRGDLEGELDGKPTDVLLITGEDDYGSVIKPRLMAHGADLHRVHRLRICDDLGSANLLTLPADVSLVEGEVDELRDDGRVVSSVVVDPIGAFLGSNTDSHKDAQVRRALAPLAAMAERLDLAVIVVAHLTKDESSRLINRVSGSGAFVNAARSVLGFCRNPDDPDGESGRERVLVHVASNWGRLAPSLAARVESRDIEVDDGTITDTAFLNVIGETALSAGDLQRDGEGGGKAELARHWLLERLKPGTWEDSGAIKTEGEEAGHSVRTLQRVFQALVKEGAGEAKTEGFPPRSLWRIPVRANPVGANGGTEVGANGENGSTEPNLGDSVPRSRQDLVFGANGQNGVPPGSDQEGVCRREAGELAGRHKGGDDES
jgi:hypothetical protein